VDKAIFENMRDLNLETYLRIASEHGIPEGEISRVLDEKAYEDRIKSEVAEATKYQVSSTPTSFVNGKRMKGAKPYEEFKKAVDEALAKIEQGRK